MIEKITLKTIERGCLNSYVVGIKLIREEAQQIMSIKNCREVWQI